MSSAVQHPTSPPSNEADAISRIVRRLQQQFPELPVETVEKAVLGQYEQFEGRPVRDFVPILVERAAQDQLRTGDAARG